MGILKRGIQILDDLARDAKEGYEAKKAAKKAAKESKKAAEDEARIEAEVERRIAERDKLQQQPQAQAQAPLTGEAGVAQNSEEASAEALNNALNRAQVEEAAGPTINMEQMATADLGVPEGFNNFERVVQDPYKATATRASSNSEPLLKRTLTGTKNVAKASWNKGALYGATVGGVNGYANTPEDATLGDVISDTLFGALKGATIGGPTVGATKVIAPKIYSLFGSPSKWQTAKTLGVTGALGAATAAYKAHGGDFLDYLSKALESKDSKKSNTKTTPPAGTYRSNTVAKPDTVDGNEW